MKPRIPLTDLKFLEKTNHCPGNKRHPSKAKTWEKECKPERLNMKRVLIMNPGIPALDFIASWRLIRNHFKDT